jgi:hypothetical protein
MLKPQNVTHALQNRKIIFQNENRFHNTTPLVFLFTDAALMPGPVED